jgi:hypothetical protein
VEGEATEATGGLRARSVTGKSRFGATRQLTGNPLNSVELRDLSGDLGLAKAKDDDSENGGSEFNTADRTAATSNDEDLSTNDRSEYSAHEETSSQYEGDDNSEYVERTEEDASENPEESEQYSHDEDGVGYEEEEEYEEYSGEENNNDEEGGGEGFGQEGEETENYFNAYANAHRDLIDGLPPVEFLDTETSPYDHLEKILTPHDPATLFSDLTQIG